MMGTDKQAAKYWMLLIQRDGSGGLDLLVGGTRVWPHSAQTINGGVQSIWDYRNTFSKQAVKRITSWTGGTPVETNQRGVGTDRV